MKKEPKDQVLKARVTRSMKAAVTAAAAQKSGDNDAEANIVREAVEEYLVRRGYITSESPIVALRVAESPPSSGRYGSSNRTENNHPPRGKK